jgi:hypothetical protein
MSNKKYWRVSLYTGGEVQTLEIPLIHFKDKILIISLLDDKKTEEKKIKKFVFLLPIVLKTQPRQEKDTIFFFIFHIHSYGCKEKKGVSPFVLVNSDECQF